MTEERIETLMVKVADELATDAEREELMAFLSDRPDLMKELEAHQAIRAVTGGWVDRLNQDLIAASGSASMGQGYGYGVGLLLFLGGMAALMLGGVAEFWTDPEVPLWAQAGVSAMGLGALILLIRAIYIRSVHHKHDPYTEVQR